MLAAHHLALHEDKVGRRLYGVGGTPVAPVGAPPSPLSAAHPVARLRGHHLHSPLPQKAHREVGRLRPVRRLWGYKGAWSYRKLGGGPYGAIGFPPRGYRGFSGHFGGL